MNCDRHNNALLQVTGEPGTLCCIAGCLVASGDAPTKLQARGQNAPAVNVRAKRTATALPTEHEEQVALFKRIDENCDRYPELRCIFAVPNAGAGGSKGQAGKMKAEGTRAGVPDLLCAVARRGYHGAFVEMKRQGNYPTKEQREWHIRLAEQGFPVKTAYSAAEGWEWLCWYLDLKEKVER